MMIAKTACHEMLAFGGAHVPIRCDITAAPSFQEIQIHSQRAVEDLILVHITKAGLQFKILKQLLVYPGGYCFLFYHSSSCLDGHSARR